MSGSRWFDKSLVLRDGVRLISRIWLPNSNGPWPALLMRQPYGREIASTITYSHPEWWASKGYMVIIQDVRGMGSSEGVFNGFSQEASDTSETHEWVRSLKECNGKLGLYGFSYQGFTQLTGELNSKPPDCLSPAMTGMNIKDHWCSDGGAYWWHNNIAWGLQIAALKMKRENNLLAWEKIRLTLENKSYLRDGIDILKNYDPNAIAYDSKLKHHYLKHEKLETIGYGPFVNFVGNQLARSTPEALRKSGKLKAFMPNLASLYYYSLSGNTKKGEYGRFNLSTKMKSILNASEGFFIDSGGCRKYFAYGWD